MGGTREYVEKQIDYFFKKADGTPEGTLEDGVYKFYLPEGNIADLEAVLSAIFHKNVELDLTQQGSIFEEVLDDDYTFSVKNNIASEYLDILINESKTYIITYVDVGNYANFSVVSDKLNQPTNQQ